MTTTQTIQLTDHSDLDVRFSGWFLGCWTSQSTKQEERWTEINVYFRPSDRWPSFDEWSGSLVIQTIGRTTKSGEKDRYKVEVVDDATNVKEIIATLGKGPLAKRIYADLQIDAVREI